MPRLQPFKYELVPSGKQQRQVRRCAGSCRFMCNEALAVRKTNHEAVGASINDVDMAKPLTAWHHGVEAVWLKNVPVHPLQHVLNELERVAPYYFVAKRAGFPLFKKMGQGARLRESDSKPFKLDQANHCAFLRKLGWRRYRYRPNMLGTVKNVAASASSGQWGVSIQTEGELVQPIPNGGGVGIAMGVARFPAVSDGSFYARSTASSGTRTGCAGAAGHDPRTKFSSNRRKRRAQVRLFTPGPATRAATICKKP